ncbi:MAG: hypothetical protein FWD12_11810 [Alphaproteobacteria bacterium]|nr:hypothetical protein [Alphaproteobacteria bacterium]
MAAQRRPMVEGLSLASASAARYEATVSGVAGSEATLRVLHQAWKAAKSAL